MKTLKFIRIADITEKAIKVIVRESGYDLEKLKVVNEEYIWLPKLVCQNITANSVEVADWFYEKNIAVDTYAAFMKAMSNS
jgi:hypothetical protein